MPSKRLIFHEETFYCSVECFSTQNLCARMHTTHSFNNFSSCLSIASKDLSCMNKDGTAFQMLCVKTNTCHCIRIPHPDRNFYIFPDNRNTYQGNAGDRKVCEHKHSGSNHGLLIYWHRKLFYTGTCRILWDL
jgi:hypothetical protein